MVTKYHPEIFPVISGTNNATNNVRDINGAGYDGQWIDLSKSEGGAYLIQVGNAGATAAVTIEQSTTAAASGEKTVVWTERYSAADTSAAQTLVKTTVSSNTFNIAASNGQTHMIPIRASQLDTANDFRYVRLRIADPGSATLVSVSFIPALPMTFGDGAHQKYGE